MPATKVKDARREIERQLKEVLSVNVRLKSVDGSADPLTDAALPGRVIYWNSPWCSCGDARFFIVGRELGGDSGVRLRGYPHVQDSHIH